MNFSTRRGRPKNMRTDQDHGTPELIHKKLHGLTIEPVDRYLAEQFISPTQHWCGVHLRWLYTLRYGAPDVRAIDPTHFGGIEIRLNDPNWQADREEELTDALVRLAAIRALPTILRMCIYNEWIAPKRGNEWYKLCEGLDLLVELWKK